MEVILLERVKNLGSVGDRVNVRSGFGRNFLIPYGKAVPANHANIQAFESRRAELEAAAAMSLEAAQARQAALADMTVTIAAKAGTEGKLFGSVGNREIAAALKAAGVEVDKTEVRLPDGPIRQVGEYSVSVHLHSDIEGTVSVQVIAGA